MTDMELWWRARAAGWQPPATAPAREPGSGPRLRDGWQGAARAALARGAQAELPFSARS